MIDYILIHFITNHDNINYIAELYLFITNLM